MTPLQPPKGRYVTLSIHDVSPHTFPIVKEMIARLEMLGARHFSLLVIPNHHNLGHFLDAPEFCHWLQERTALGDEAVIHGYYHLRHPHPRESLRDKITTRFYTAGEGEFFDINGADALRLVIQAREEFRMLGINPEGFIAPAWLLSPGGEAALRKLGLLYTTRLKTVCHLPTGQTYPTQSLVWSARSFWRRMASRLWNSMLARRLRHNPLMRIGIHPVDFRYRGLWRQIETLASRALADRTPITYAGWVTAATAPISEPAHALKS